MVGAAADNNDDGDNDDGDDDGDDDVVAAVDVSISCAASVSDSPCSVKLAVDCGIKSTLF